MVIPLAILTFYAVHIAPTKLFLHLLILSLGQSFLQATVSTAISLPLGLLFGIVLIVYNGRLKSTFISVLLVTYVLPGIIMALGIVSIFGFSSRFWEIIYGNVVYNSPMVAVLAYSTGNSTNLKEVYSAKLLGAPDRRVVSGFYLPNALRGGLLGGILTFILSFEGFSLPLIIGGPSYSTVEVMIYEFKSIFPTFAAFPFSTSSFLGLIQIAILVTPLLIYLDINLRSRRNDTVLPLPLRRYNKIAFVALLLFVIFILFPLFGMFVRYPLWEINLASITSKLQLPISLVLWNTVTFSFASTFLAFMISVLVALRPSTFRRGFVVMLPLIFSPVTLALSYFLVYGELVPNSLLIILIFTVVAIPVTIRMMTQALVTIPPSEVNSSKVLGGSPISTLFRVQIPRIKWEISTVISLMFITVMGEFSSVVTVYTTTTQTITVGIYKLLLLRDLPGTYFLTEIFLAVIFISSFIINQFGKSGSVGQA